MQTAWLESSITYDGTQLRAHWIHEQTGLLGDAIASFTGPADVPTAHMCDLVDVRNDAPIFSRSMLHFIVEHFECDLPLAVARQRLLVAIAAEEMSPRCSSIRRTGNDLYAGERKLSVSIATISSVSTLIHFAINIESDGTPVPTLGLRDLGIEPHALADAIMRRYIEEIATMHEARCKVRAVK